MCVSKMLQQTLLAFCLQIILLASPEVNSARILGVFPMPSISHQFVFRKFVDELVNRGHEVVTITPNPKYPNGGGPENLTEIDVSFSYTEFGEIVAAGSKKEFPRGVIMRFDAISERYDDLVKIYANQMSCPEVKRILEDKHQKFDLIIAEALFNYHLIVRTFYKAPIILISSYFGAAENFETLGAVARHPILYPNTLRDKFRNLSYWETLKEIHNEIKLRNTFLQISEIENRILKQNYGPNAPTTDELQKDIDLLFLNSHPLFNHNRAVPPNVIYLGALHMEPPKELPQELKSYLDDSKRGVIYVSLGTNVRPSQMHKDFLDSFLQAFEAIPYDILWKFDGDSLENVPKNVKVQKWFPQRDLLLHPNIKLFVMQGGLQSTDEAIDAGVPLVGIPFLGDQWSNVNKYVELGIGIEIDAATMTAKDLVDGVNTVLSDDSYRQNMKRIREVMRDQPQTAMERAMWWTEHVLRHGGGKHLRSPAANISWSEYLMLDILAPLFAALIVLTILVIIAVCKIIKAVFKPKRKVKKS